MSPTRAPLAPVALAAYLALACSTDGLTGIAAHLVGSWEASKMEYISPADTVQRVDVVAGGEGLTIEFAASGRYALTYTVPGREPEVEAGDWEVEGATLVMVCDCDLDHPASLAPNSARGRSHSRRAPNSTSTVTGRRNRRSWSLCWRGRSLRRGVELLSCDQRAKLAGEAT